MAKAREQFADGLPSLILKTMELINGSSIKDTTYPQLIQALPKLIAMLPEGERPNGRHELTFAHYQEMFDRLEREVPGKLGRWVEFETVKAERDSACATLQPLRDRLRKVETENFQLRSAVRHLGVDKDPDVVLRELGYDRLELPYDPSDIFSNVFDPFGPPPGPPAPIHQSTGTSDGGRGAAALNEEPPVIPAFASLGESGRDAAPADTDPPAASSSAATPPPREQPGLLAESPDVAAGP